ncbi:DNA-binding transcriptional regulator, MocR family, contains an aminotransferase domain [Geosmithia morbida]|uniref:DNA-binding transcriptional regulator, MocR family, contains an aminotransferase domain n=1 Tax=Geosmithia morbida TaxID=1094350 RepID=A0A9P4YQ22_9HYPO|nr:DNA-binding transcriptional regulator, MocR family, contains an aminotransferase domain [Geosmithia morbida]KAF4119694.1 DNA-binding transcriptional regulator, MocR family, contains an aminotransferase domain [Geosmithia morbida]
MASSPQLSPPCDLSHHYSRTTKNRTQSAIKKFYHFFQIPGIGNLAGGLPNEKLFPFDTLEAQVAQPRRWTPRNSNNDTSSSSSSSNVDPATALHLTVPKSDPTADPFSKIDVATALQYGTASGYPPLLSFVRQFTRNNLHPNVPYAGGPEVILTCGATDGFSKTVELLFDPWSPYHDPIEERPGLVCEAFVYRNAPDTAAARGVSVTPVEYDSEGMLAHGPGGLKDVLDSWDPTKGRRPSLVYTVTMGHNPTSGVLSVQRRREIYALCSEYDLIIAEDDPYWYLQYPSAARAEAESRNCDVTDVDGAPYTPSTSSGYDFLDSLVPSYLSVDTDGRVIRIDTFSKTVAPGSRLGWITAQPAIIERITRITESSTQQPSGFVQSLIAQLVIGHHQAETVKTFFSLSAREKLAFEGWKMDGWVRWLEGLRGVYENRMNRMSSILDGKSYQLKQSTPVISAVGYGNNNNNSNAVTTTASSTVGELDTEWGVITKTRLLSFDWPRGGMFIWVRVHLESHPLFRVRGHSVARIDGSVLSTALMMFLTHKPYLVIVSPGAMFGANEDIASRRGWQFFRLCFAAEEEERIDSCAHGFADGVQRFWRIKSVDQIETLVDEFHNNIGAAGGLDLEGQGMMGC